MHPAHLLSNVLATSPSDLPLTHGPSVLRFESSSIRYEEVRSRKQSILICMFQRYSGAVIYTYVHSLKTMFGVTLFDYLSFLFRPRKLRLFCDATGTKSVSRP